MSNTFIPVDLDQVLDEFEEQEKNHQDTFPPTRPNTLTLPNGYQELKPHSSSEPRTYSFNSPLEAILGEPSTTVHNRPCKSLAQELADLDLGVHIGSNDDDDDIDGDDDLDSTSAVIAAAEKITSENNFGLNLHSSNHGFNDFSDENDHIVDSSIINPSDTVDYNKALNEIEDDTDFFSLLNSVVEDKSPFSLETSQPTTVPPCGIKDEMSSTELSNQRKDSSDFQESTKDNNLDNTEQQSSDVEDTSLMYHDISDKSVTNNATGTQISATSSIDHVDSNVDYSINKDSIAQDTAADQISDTFQLDNSSEETFYKDDTNSNDLQAVDTSNYVSPVLDEFGAESSNSLLVDGEIKNKPVPSSTSSDLTLNVDNETEPILIDLSTPQTEHSLSDNSLSNTNELVEALGENSGNVSGNADQFHQHTSDMLSIGSGEAEGLPIQSQVNISEVDSGSADSLCGDERIPAANEVERTLTPDSLLSDGLQPVHISSGDPEMGFVPPIWVPDEVATHCMTCGIKFSMIKRKHHCRACGRVLCSSCCNMKYPLPYMGNKDARVCQVCCDILIQSSNQHTEDLTQLEGHVEETTEEENNPIVSTEDLTTDLLVEDDNAGSSTMATEQIENTDQVLSESLDDNDDNHDDDDDIDNDDSIDGPSDVVDRPVLTLPADPSLPGNTSHASMSSAPLSPALSDDSDLSFRLDVEHVRALIPQDSFTLPPVLTLNKKVFHIQERPDTAEIMYRLKGLGDTVIFLLNKNLIVKVKIVKLRCCVKKKCWCFVTDGMGAANQEEMVVLLECEHSENTFPKDVLSHFNTAFTYAKQGHVVSDLGFTIFGQPFLGSSNNAGFLYIKPTFQCLENLPLPTIPYIVGILIQRQEAPWAQLFPIRLMLRLGTEFRYYPCPLWSVRNREPVYHEIGHTIMNLLTDFKNFQYSVPRITGLVIHMEDTKTTIKLPQDRFDEVVKVLNAAEEHMFAFGANFSSGADAHLVCIQEGESYKTQAINIQNKTRTVTGASFVVFTGSLKSSNPNDAKVSIIEDGLMIQMLPDAVLELRKALREMQDYAITIGSNATQNSVTNVNIEWVSRDTNKQTYTSPIDGRSLTDVPSIQVHSSCDFSKRDIYRIRWTNVFLERSGSSSRGLSSRGLTRLTGELARACCEALGPYLQGLFNMGLTQLSLRVNVDAESVEYSIGSNQQPLPTNLMADLDSALIPSINAAAMKYRRGPLTVELFFSIISLF